MNKQDFSIGFATKGLKPYGLISRQKGIYNWPKSNILLTLPVLPTKNSISLHEVAVPTQKTIIKTIKRQGKKSKKIIKKVNVKKQKQTSWVAVDNMLGSINKIKELR